MRIIIDESVSYTVAKVLRNAGYDVVAIAEGATASISDENIYKLALRDKALLITRDYHFTNPVRFGPQKTGGILYIRRGNLSSSEEGKLIQRFLATHEPKEYRGRLVTLYLEGVKIR